MSEDFFDRDAIVAGRGRGRGRRRTMLFLVESFSDPDGPDAGAALDFLAATEIFGGLDRDALRGNGREPTRRTVVRSDRRHGRSRDGCASRTDVSDSSRWRIDRNRSPGGG